MTCPTCGRVIPVGFSTCNPCRERTRMEVDIRARILWGEARDEVRADWLRKGSADVDVDSLLRVALQERRQHFRTRGFQDLVIALLLLLLGAGAFGIYRAGARHEITLRGKTGSLVMAAMVFLPVVGLILSTRGVRRVMIGGEQTEAASDLSELD